MTTRTAIIAWSYVLLAIEGMMLFLVPWPPDPRLRFVLSLPLATMIFRLIFQSIDVKSYERLILYRGGKFVDSGLQGGRAFLLRGFERAMLVDMRPRELSVEPVTCFSEEGIPVNIGYYLLWQIIDPVRYLLGLPNAPATLERLLTASLRDTIEHFCLDRILVEREQIAQGLHTGSLAQLARWGIKIVELSLGDVQIPEHLAKAMGQRQIIEALRSAQISQAKTYADVIRVMQERLELPKEEAPRLLMPMILAGAQISRQIAPEEWRELFRYTAGMTTGSSFASKEGK